VVIFLTTKTVAMELNYVYTLFLDFCLDMENLWRHDSNQQR
jgi:hypothetical protein